MMKKAYALVCDFCNEPFYLTHANYIKRSSTKRRTGYSRIVCSRNECRKRQRQEVIRVMYNKNVKNNTWKKIGEFRQGKTYEDLWGKEKATLARAKIRQARSMQPEPHLGHKNSVEVREKMSKAKKFFLKEHPKYLQNHARNMTRRYMDLPPEEKLKFSLRGHEVIRHIKRYTNHGKMLTWYGKEVLYESDYEKLYFQMLNNKRAWWDKNTSLLVPYYDTRDECLKYTKPDVLIYTTDFERLHTIVEVKPYEFLVNPKGKNNKYYQVTKDKHDSLLGYCKEYHLNMAFITELDLEGEISSFRDIVSFSYRKKKAQLYENKFHGLQEIMLHERPYITGVRRFETDGYILKAIEG